MAEGPTRERRPVVELRQYTLHPGQREVLIDLFDRVFVSGQADVGINVIGQFGDVDAENRFVWLRSFPDMESRARSLAAFYEGPVWRAHRDIANATMVDSDNVLLLRPARPGSMFRVSALRGDGLRRPAQQAPVGAAVHALAAGADEARAVSWFESVAAARIAASGGKVLAYFVTDPSANTYPRLPVRQDLRVFVWIAGATDLDSLNRVMLSAAAKLPPRLSDRYWLLRLAPTPRSRLHGGAPGCRAWRKGGRLATQARAGEPRRPRSPLREAVAASRRP